MTTTDDYRAGFHDAWRLAMGEAGHIVFNRLMVEAGDPDDVIKELEHQRFNCRCQEVNRGDLTHSGPLALCQLDASEAVGP